MPISLLLLAGYTAVVAALADSPTCETLAAGTCWANKKGKIRHKTTSNSTTASGADVCCPACAAEPKCVAWTYIPTKDSGKPPGCDLYENNGPLHQKKDGCASGTYPKGPTPAPAPSNPTPAPPSAPTGTHNILFIIDESTDSRAYFTGNNGQRAESPMELPNLARLMKEGTSFNNTYVHVPVCCPSRGTIAAGRFQHRIPHMQTNPDTGLFVRGS